MAELEAEALTKALNDRVRQRSYLGLTPKKYEVDAFQDGWEAARKYAAEQLRARTNRLHDCDEPEVPCDACRPGIYQNLWDGQWRTADGKPPRG
jgi:hypothetical protein